MTTATTRCVLALAGLVLAHRGTAWADTVVDVNLAVSGTATVTVGFSPPTTGPVQQQGKLAGFLDFTDSLDALNGWHLAYTQSAAVSAPPFGDQSVPGFLTTQLDNYTPTVTLIGGAISAVTFQDPLGSYTFSIEPVGGFGAGPDPISTANGSFDYSASIPGEGTPVFVEVFGSYSAPLGPASAVPEPSTLISAGIAGAVALGCAWRRRTIKRAA